MATPLVEKAINGIEMVNEKALIKRMLAKGKVYIKRMK